jgi:hypothetical protein
MAYTTQENPSAYFVGGKPEIPCASVAAAELRQIGQLTKDATVG